ncbi:uncharacterized protein TM35_000681080 [Trypanosoma theileri]|uniref:Mucin TcMUCII n=1 Tax=Trypanosoma theileri TaxID=67003 RepID=A0A1X0NFI5_9TRYP|nr:uncharacterized protein TM35_000681080 [Trypanosoma theileri]ORC83476.1 hypothetical protein TM35_000681080 [Trypanosoma theileri]
MMLLRHVLCVLVLSFSCVCGCVGADAEGDVLQETELAPICSDASADSNCRGEKTPAASISSLDLGTSRTPGTNTALKQEQINQLEENEQERMQEDDDRKPGQPEGSKVQDNSIIPNSSGRSTTEDNHELRTNPPEVTQSSLSQASDALQVPQSPSSFSPPSSGSTQGRGGGPSHVQPGNSDHPQAAEDKAADDSKRENPYMTDTEQEEEKTQENPNSSHTTSPSETNTNNSEPQERSTSQDQTPVTQDSQSDTNTRESSNADHTNTDTTNTPSNDEESTSTSTTTTTTTTLPPELANNKKGDADSSSSISSSVWVRVPLLIVVTLACILVC